MQAPLPLAACSCLPAPLRCRPPPPSPPPCSRLRQHQHRRGQQRAGRLHYPHRCCGAARAAVCRHGDWRRRDHWPHGQPARLHDRGRGARGHGRHAAGGGRHRAAGAAAAGPPAPAARALVGGRAGSGPQGRARCLRPSRRPPTQPDPANSWPAQRGVVVQKGAMVAAGAVVEPGTVVPSGEIWGGRCAAAACCRRHPGASRARLRASNIHAVLKCRCGAVGTWAGRPPRWPASAPSGCATTFLPFSALLPTTGPPLLRLPSRL